MKQGQFSQEQIVAILHEAERGEKTIRGLCREHSITEPLSIAGEKSRAG